MLDGNHKKVFHDLPSIGHPKCHGGRLHRPQPQTLDTGI